MVSSVFSGLLSITTHHSPLKFALFKILTASLAGALNLASNFLVASLIAKISRSGVDYAIDSIRLKILFGLS